MSWPAPEVPCRRATDAEVPTGARRMRKVAEENGWRVVPTYARGTTPIARKWQPGKVVDSLALRMRRTGRRAVGVWVDSAFTCAFLWGDRSCQRVNATQLRAELEKP